ncbi:hypothetical protein LZ554_004708 [Drepanopeziza brunnea f. sp. 'monogermtubi']|nr:hypothetical protein LZ554_004708 [Drepanopeziza brunnea f. sp. 'monogermtubi']
MSLKRTSSHVDLTGLSDNEDVSPRAKQARTNADPVTASQQPRARQSLTRDAWGAVDEEDEIIDLSQDVDEGNGWTVVGAINGKIVGVRYYNGYATVGEQVMVKREPGNPYDSNAIRINNVQGTQIGHIPRDLASKLAPFMDARSIVLEGILAGEKGQWDCPIRLRVFGPADPAARKILEDNMKTRRVPIQKQGIAAPKKPINISHFIENSERFKPRDVEQLVEAWGQGEDALSKMPMAEQPEDLVSTLLPYQRQGLAWMLEKENPVLPAPGSKDIVQLWKRHETRKNAFQNIATSFSTQEAPVLARGGILADDMGLGKTLQIISVICEGGPGTTLIIAPVSVMSNWVQQIERHVNKERNMKIMTYHGSGRGLMTFGELGEYDVVVTTYGTLSAEYYKNAKGSVPEKLPRKHGIFSMNWARIVLDEGHTIRNPNTKSAVAATAVAAKCRWVLTGTPIVNTIKDLYSMLKFIGITGGLERLELFNAILTRPLALGDRNADLILHSIMRTLCLRRKKDMKFVDLKLPELSEYVHRIAFRPDEREKYGALRAEAQGMAQKLQSAKPGQNAYRHVLEILLRMRQVCCHWKLCGERVSDLLALLENDEVVALTKKNVAALQALLQLTIESSDECPICLEDLHNPVITACKHVFGLDCIARTIQLQQKCPLCRAELKDASVLVHPKPAEEAIPVKDIDINTKSSKTEALMSILAASRKDPQSKVVIFSQWTSFLDIIQAQLVEAGMKFARIDGSMSATVRDKGMTALESDPECRILLASLAVCSVGLNLAAADTVVLADSWWAPAIEDQAVDRVHRLGQTRPCTVWRLVMEESIEERVLDIQAEKRLLVGKAFQEKAKGDKQKTTRMGDILKLLG